MGNEPSTPVNGEGSNRNQQPSLNNARSFQPTRFASLGSLDEDDDDQKKNDVFVRRQHLRRPNSTTIAVTNDGRKPKTEQLDPVFSAAAAAASARRAKQQQQQRNTTSSKPRKSHQSKPQQRPQKIDDNEWKASLQRLATTAASTAKSFSTVAAPVLQDAGNMIAQSAKEIGTTYRAETQQNERMEGDMSYDEETVVLFPYSPAKSRSWYEGSQHSVSLTSSAPPTENILQTIQGAPKLPTLRDDSTNAIFENPSHEAADIALTNGTSSQESILSPKKRLESKSKDSTPPQTVSAPAPVEGQGLRRSERIRKQKQKVTGSNEPPVTSDNFKGGSNADELDTKAIEASNETVSAEKGNELFASLEVDAEIANIEDSTGKETEAKELPESNPEQLDPVTAVNHSLDDNLLGSSPTDMQPTDKSSENEAEPETETVLTVDVAHNNASTPEKLQGSSSTDRLDTKAIEGSDDNNSAEKDDEFSAAAEIDAEIANNDDGTGKETEACALTESKPKQPITVTATNDIPDDKHLGSSPASTQPTDKSSENAAIQVVDAVIKKTSVDRVETDINKNDAESKTSLKEATGCIAKPTNSSAQTGQFDPIEAGTGAESLGTHTQFESTSAELVKVEAIQQDPDETISSDIISAEDVRQAATSNSASMTENDTQTEGVGAAESGEPCDPTNGEEGSQTAMESSTTPGLEQNNLAQSLAGGEAPDGKAQPIGASHDTDHVFIASTTTEKLSKTSKFLVVNAPGASREIKSDVVAADSIPDEDTSIDESRSALVSTSNVSVTPQPSQNNASESTKAQAPNEGINELAAAEPDEGIISGQATSTSDEPDTNIPATKTDDLIENELSIEGPHQNDELRMKRSTNDASEHAEGGTPMVENKTLNVVEQSEASKDQSIDSAGDANDSVNEECNGKTTTTKSHETNSSQRVDESDDPNNNQLPNGEIGNVVRDGPEEDDDQGVDGPDDLTKSAISIPANSDIARGKSNTEQSAETGEVLAEQGDDVGVAANTSEAIDRPTNGSEMDGLQDQPTASADSLVNASISSDVGKVNDPGDSSAKEDQQTDNTADLATNTIVNEQIDSSEPSALEGQDRPPGIANDSTKGQHMNQDNSMTELRVNHGESKDEASDSTSSETTGVAIEKPDGAGDRSSSDNDATLLKLEESVNNDGDTDDASIPAHRQGTLSNLDGSVASHGAQIQPAADDATDPTDEAACSSNGEIAYLRVPVVIGEGKDQPVASITDRKNGGVVDADESAKSDKAQVKSAKNADGIDDAGDADGPTNPTKVEIPGDMDQSTAAAKMRSQSDNDADDPTNHGMVDLDGSTVHDEARIESTISANVINKNEAITSTVMDDVAPAQIDEAPNQQIDNIGLSTEDIILTNVDEPIGLKEDGDQSSNNAIEFAKNGTSSETHLDEPDTDKDQLTEADDHGGIVTSKDRLPNHADITLENEAETIVNGRPTSQDKPAHLETEATEDVSVTGESVDQDYDDDASSILSALLQNSQTELGQVDEADESDLLASPTHSQTEETKEFFASKGNMDDTAESVDSVLADILGDDQDDVSVVESLVENLSHQVCDFDEVSCTDEGTKASMATMSFDSHLHDSQRNDTSMPKIQSRVRWSQLTVGKLFDADPDDLVNGLDGWQTSLELRMRASLQSFRSTQAPEMLASDQSFLVRSKKAIGQDLLDHSRHVAEIVSNNWSKFHNATNERVEDIRLRPSVFDQEVVAEADSQNTISSSPENYENSTASSRQSWTKPHSNEVVGDAELLWEMVPNERNVPIEGCSDFRPLLPAPSLLHQQKQGQHNLHSLNNERETKAPQNTNSDDASQNSKGKPSPLRQRQPSTSVAMKRPENLTVDWDNKLEKTFPSVPDAEEMTDVFEGEMLDVSMLAVTSLDDIEFLETTKPNKSNVRNDLRDIAEIRWNQLVANWTHSETWKCISSGDASTSFGMPKTVEGDRAKAISPPLEDASTAQETINERCGILPASNLPQQYALSKAERDEKALASFQTLSAVGPTSMVVTEGTLMKHTISLKDKDVKSDDITKLLESAKDQLANFKMLVGNVVHYASQNEVTGTFLDQPSITSSVGLKTYESIKSKAARKYKGDVYQVKDVLRAQITFPDPDSLLCALIYLKSAELNRKDESDVESSASLAIVRIKNLFHGAVQGPAHPLPPTGYRHVLLTVRFGDGLLAEIQCQLSIFYDILRENGYKLHQQVTSIEEKMSTRNDALVKTQHLQTPTSSLASYLRQGATDSNPKNGTLVGSSDSKLLVQLSSNKSDTTNQPGDNAAAATANSQQQSVPNETEDNKSGSVGVFAGGGIAAAAAMAAARKNSTTSLDDNHDSDANNPFGGGDIAAAAALAAAKKQSPSADDKPVRANPFGGGGIAAAAAMAAAKKQQKQTSSTNKEGKDNKPTSPFGGGGIAAAAAMAAAKKQQKQTGSDDKPTSPFGGGGIAAAAAMAAAKKQQKQSNIDNNDIKESKPASPFGGGGLAAAAAMAAAKKQQKQIAEGNAEVKESKPASPFGGGGIAAAAAMAAAKKQQKQSNVDSSEIKESKSASPFGGGGIAATAAMAAAKKQQKQIAEGNAEIKENKPASPFGGGGIAAAAAMAAAKKQQKQSAEGSAEIKESKPASPFGGGGIAAAAAMAAAKKVQPTISNPDSETQVNDEKNIVDNHPVEGDAASEQITAGSSLPEFKQSELLLAMIDAAFVQAIRNPRELATLHCLGILIQHELRHISTNASNQGDHRRSLELSNAIMLRCLEIANQASSNGMLGWLEYGSSGLLQRNPALPMEIVHRLASNFVSIKDFQTSFDILSGLRRQCGSKLPRNHPITVGISIDLAISAAATGRNTFARHLVKGVTADVALFLHQREVHFFQTSREMNAFNRSGTKALYMDAHSDQFFQLKVYASALDQQLQREFIVVTTEHNPMVLSNKMIVADTWMVVANCLTAGNNDPSNSKRERAEAKNRSKPYWKRACSLHQESFRGWLSIETGILAYQAACAGYGVARCLRELGRIKEALQLLNLIVSRLESSSNTNKSGKGTEERAKSSEASYTIYMLPRTGRILGKGVVEGNNGEGRREEILVLCLWMMAVLSAEDSPDERGRIRALSLLHGASNTLERVLKRRNDSKHQGRGASTRVPAHLQTLHTLYECVQSEARALYEPLEMAIGDSNGTGGYRLNDQLAEATPRDWREVLTPMRRKRWESKHLYGDDYISPRKTIRGKKEARKRNASVDVTAAI